MSYIQIQTTKPNDKFGGSFKAYLAKPAKLPAPALIVAQEIFGVNKVMRDLCDGFAEQGYLALCPDLFWRQEPGVDITDQSEAEWAKAFELYKGFDENLGVADLIATLAYARKMDGCNGKAGSLGYCLGGKLAFRMATDSDSDCNVSYYGVGIENALDKAGNIQKPLLMHMAEKDKFVPPEAQSKIKSALAKNSFVTIHSYAGLDHAFARIGGDHYDAQSARTANDRTAEFLRKNLV